MGKNETCGRFNKTGLPETAGARTKLESVAALKDVEGEWMEILLARILERIWPMHVSANASKRAILSSFSVYTTTSRTASESLRLVSVDSAASTSRNDRALVRIWLATATLLDELAGEAVRPGACFYVNEKLLR
jgi:hypothetical protein